MLNVEVYLQKLYLLSFNTIPKISFPACLHAIITLLSQ